MGRVYRFHCAKCGYAVECSGGGDTGRFAATTTVVCEQCRGLQDVVMVAGAPEPQCPKDMTHRVRRWKHPGKCPKCGEGMLRGEVTALWD